MRISPPEVVRSITAAGDGSAPTGTLFERIVDAAGRVDLSSLDDSRIGRSRPLADFALEMMMIAATNPGLIADIKVDREWVTVRRGAADLPLDDFRLGERWTDFFGYLP